MHHVMKGGNSELYELLDELDISITQMKALHTLDSCADEVSVKDISQRLGLSLPGASRTVDGMLKRGWLERREDDQDRRIKRVRISDDGRDVVRRIDSARLHGFEAFTQTLSPEQRTQLYDALSTLPHHDPPSA